jgi:hypothetical protein
MFSVERQGLVQSLRAGRCLEQAAREYCARPTVAMELWNRSLELRIAELEMALRSGRGVEQRLRRTA